MTVNLNKFNYDLDKLVKSQSDSPVATDPALQIAAFIVTTNFDADALPPLNLRTRWITDTKSKLLNRRFINLRKIVANPWMAILITLALLFMFSGVVYALGKALGYFPGLGLVNQNTAYQVLAEPFAQTRNGVTITIEKAIRNTDAALIVFKVDGLTPDKFSIVEAKNTCMASEELHFTGGLVLKPMNGSSEPLDGGFESSYKFTDIPEAATDAVLFIPCIQGALSPGILPENWEIPIHWIPASPEMVLTTFPVTDITASSADQNKIATSSNVSTPLSEASRNSVNPLAVTQIIETGDGYILIGEFNPPAPTQPGEWDTVTLNLTLTDAHGQTIDWQPPSDIDLPAAKLPNQKIWAISFSKDFSPPVQINYQSRYVIRSNSQQTYSLEFDAGDNPQLGQHWQINHDFQLDGHPIHLTTISADLTGYFISFESTDPSVNSLSAQIDGYTPNNSGGSVGISSWNLYLFYPEMPKGRIKLILSNLYLNGETKDWSLDWQP